MRGWLLGIAGVLLLGGCRTAIHPACDGGVFPIDELGPFERVPSPRMGSIPYPSLVSLFTTADPAELGEHRYRVGSPFKWLGEADRGLIYTERGGFVDLAHVRNTIDHAAHAHARVRTALVNGQDCVRYRLAEPSIYRVEFAYPEAWWALADDERAALADEVAAQAAMVLGLESMTWHEILTWFDYRSTVVISEKPSSFTYDDPMSHALGALVARDALLTTGANADGARFETEVTRQLSEALQSLGAVGPEATRSSVDAVEGLWWDSDGVKRRYVAGASDAITGWRIPGDSAQSSELRVKDASESVGQIVEFRFPGLDRLVDSEACPKLRVLVDPAVKEGNEILAALAETRGLVESADEVDMQHDFPALQAWIREAILRELGPAGLGGEQHRVGTLPGLEGDAD